MALYLLCMLCTATCSCSYGRISAFNTRPSATSLKASFASFNPYESSFIPDHNFRSLRHDLSTAIEVRKLRSPAAANIEMFLVEIQMRIE